MRVVNDSFLVLFLMFLLSKIQIWQLSVDLQKAELLYY